MKTIMVVTISAGLALAVVGCGSGPRATRAVRSSSSGPAAVVYDWDAFSMATRSDVWLGGQPSDEALDAFAERARGAMVINLRSNEEMAAQPGYAEKVAERGLRYVHVPVTGETLNRGKFEQVEAAIASADGPVMLHCGSGSRVTYLWGMHLIENRGLTVEEARSWCHARRGEPWEVGDAALAVFAGREAAAGTTALAVPAGSEPAVALPALPVLEPMTGEEASEPVEAAVIDEDAMPVEPAAAPPAATEADPEPAPRLIVRPPAPRPAAPEPTPDPARDAGALQERFPKLRPPR